MELKEIQDLIKFVAKSGVSEVQLENKGFKLVIKTNHGGEARTVEMPHAPVPVIAASPAVSAAVVNVPSSEAPKTAESQAAKPPKAESASDESKYVVVKSPMIGTFYRAAGPDKPVFVSVGDEIKPGKVLCIIEAMKLFNEIESELSGRIVKVLADDSSPVEYDQPLFLVDPS